MSAIKTRNNVNRDSHYDYGLFMTVLTAFPVPGPKVHNKKQAIVGNNSRFKIQFPLSRIIYYLLLLCYYLTLLFCIVLTVFCVIPHGPFSVCQVTRNRFTFSLKKVKKKL